MDDTQESFIKVKMLEVAFDKWIEKAELGNSEVLSFLSLYLVKIFLQNRFSSQSVKASLKKIFNEFIIHKFKNQESEKFQMDIDGDFLEEFLSEKCVYRNNINN